VPLRIHRLNLRPFRVRSTPNLADTLRSIVATSRTPRERFRPAVVLQRVQHQSRLLPLSREQSASPSALRRRLHAPACRDTRSNRASVPCVFASRPSVLHETGQVFVSLQSHSRRVPAAIPPLRTVVASPLCSYARREYTSRIATPSSTSSSLANRSDRKRQRYRRILRRLVRNTSRATPIDPQSVHSQPPCDPCTRDCTSRVALASSRLP